MPCAAQTTPAPACSAPGTGMVLPLPFGRGVLVCGAPILVPREGMGRRACRQIEAAMTRAAERGGRAVPGVIAAGMALGAARAARRCCAAMLRRRVARGKEDRGPARRSVEGIEPTPRPPGPLLWLHAASVGEAVSVAAGADQPRARGARR